MKLYALFSYFINNSVLNNSLSMFIPVNKFFRSNVFKLLIKLVIILTTHPLIYFLIYVPNDLCPHNIILLAID